MSLDMNAENEIRELLGQHVDSIGLGELAAVDQIGINAGRRTRRTRMMGGLATVVIVAAMLMGVGTALREPDSSTVFADQAEGELVAWQVVPFEDGYIGLSTYEPGALDELGNIPLVVVGSSDGTQWTKIPNSPVFISSSSALAVHDGVVHIVTTRTTEAITPTRRQASYVLNHAWSDDLAQWQTLEQPLPEGLHGEEEGVRLQASVAADAGVLVLVNSSTANAVIDELITNAGIDPAETCNREYRPRLLVIRACGVEGATRISIEDAAGPAGSMVPLFAAPGEYFVPTKVPEPAAVPNGPPPTIYRAGGGFGFVDRQVSESADGLTWRVIELDDDLPWRWLVAASDSERLYRARSTVVGSEFAPNQPVEWGLSTNDAASMESFEPETSFDHYRWFSHLEATPTGWLLIGGRTLTEDREKIEIDGLTREPRSFELTEDGITLAGELPSGPAVLSDETGRTLRRWDYLEPTNVTWSGLEHTDVGVAISDEASETPLVEFSAEQWAGLMRMSETRIMMSDILFSTDAKNWTVVSSTLRFPFVHASTEDELLVTFLTPSFDQHSPPIEVLQLPVGE